MAYTSFYIPHGRKFQIIEGVVKAPIKEEEITSREFSVEFVKDVKDFEVYSHISENTAFSFVYNK